MTDNEQKKIFAENINRILYERGKTQKEVADAIGVLPSTFNTWAKGVALPRIGKVQLLADYLGVTKNDLIDERTASDIEQGLIDDYICDSKIRELVLFAGGMMPKEARDKFIEAFIAAGSALTK